MNRNAFLKEIVDKCKSKSSVQANRGCKLSDSLGVCSEINFIPTDILTNKVCTKGKNVKQNYRDRIEFESRTPGRKFNTITTEQKRTLTNAVWLFPFIYRRFRLSI